MRGNTVFTMKPPTLGLRADVPAHLVPEGALIDGQNCFLDIDGLFKPRYGYAPWKTVNPGTTPILGLLHYTDTDGTNQYVAATTTKIYTIKNNAWTAVTPNNYLTGASTDLVRIVDYLQPYMGNFISAIFANNHDPLQVWNRDLTNAQNLTPTYNDAASTSKYAFNTVPTFAAYSVGQQIFFYVGVTNTAPAQTITGITLSGTSATALIAATAGFYVGQGVSITGVTPSTLNGLGIITSFVLNTSITYTQPGVSGAYVSGGTATGGSTLNLNADGIIPLRYLNAGVVSELPVNYLKTGAGNVYNVAYDGTEFLIGTNLLAPIARDVFVLNQRLVALNILVGSVRSPSQVVWSSAYDGQSWPASAFQNLFDTNDPLIAGRVIGQNAAVVYGEESAWLMQGAPGGGDAGAFVFTPISGVGQGNAFGSVIGPVSTQAIVPYGGVHYYLARDARIWTCDGFVAQPVSEAIDAVLQTEVNLNKATSAFAFYVPRQKQIWFMYQANTSALTGPSHAAVIAMRSSGAAFEPIQVFSEIVTAAAPVVADTGITWNLLTQGWNTETVPWSSFASASQLISLLAAGKGTIHQFGPASPNDNLVTIPYFFIPSLMNAGPLKDILLDALEMWLTPSSTFELATVELDALTFPLDNAPTVLTAFALNAADKTTFALPKSLPTLNTYSRYIRMTFSGASFNRSIAFGGAQFFYTPQDRGSN